MNPREWLEKEMIDVYAIRTPLDVEWLVEKIWKAGYEQGYNDGYAIGEDPPY